MIIQRMAASTPSSGGRLETSDDYSLFTAGSRAWNHRPSPRALLRGLRSPHAVSALFAPAAMLVGALGLAGVWTALPRAPEPWAVSAEPASAPAALPAPPLQQAAARQSRALSTLLANLGAVRIAPPSLPVVQGSAQSLAALRDAEARIIFEADAAAQARISSMRRTLRTAGLDARPYMAAQGPSAAVSPLELRDARVLAARLDVDLPLARNLQRAARDLIAANALADAVASAPLAEPVDDPVVSSPFGVRVDPFQGQAAFHPGEDFSGRYGQAIHATAPGVVSFAGQRSGYGDCLEVDHGHGFKTRYGHLSGFVARVGEAVRTGDTVALMGSTGRSTGVHLHYEVWANGRLLNPARFLEAGAVRS